ncbi:MAG: hypothetical protein WAQ08_02735 [Aquabacterium sp.]|jgi:hypothetical protein|uniref:hypothetical protein n=1 Tax=Aquabacterium sp. TaxID=1872578 RepID=UPI003BAE67AB
MDMIKLQEQFIEELLESTPEDWERIEVHYERYAWSGETSEIYIANSFVGSEKTDLDLTIEALEGLQALQDHPPQGQAEPWTWLKFVLDDSGRYHFDYQYGVPPLVAREMAAQKG